MRLSPRKRSQGRWLAILLALVLTMSNLSGLSVVYADTSLGNETTDGGGSSEGQEPGGGSGEGQEPGSGSGEGQEPGGGSGEGQEPGGGTGEGQEPGDGSGEGQEPGDGSGEGQEPGGGSGEGQEPGDGSGEGQEPGGGSGEGQEPGGGSDEGQEPGGGSGEGQEPGDGTGEGQEPEKPTERNQAAIDKANEIIAGFTSADYNAATNSKMQISATAAIADGEIPVGEEFAVEVAVWTNLNDNVMYENDNILSKCFTKNGIETLEVFVELPTEIGLASTEFEHVVQADGKTIVTVPFSNLKSSTVYGSFNVFIKGNGTTPSLVGSKEVPLKMPVTASGEMQAVTAYEGDEVVSSEIIPFEMTKAFKTLEAVGTAEGKWDITKEANEFSKESLNTDGTFKVSYSVMAGKLDGNSITVSSGDYDLAGQLLFEAVSEEIPLEGIPLAGPTSIEAGKDYFFIKESIPKVYRGEETELAKNAAGKDIMPVAFKVTNGYTTLLEGKNKEGFEPGALMGYMTKTNTTAGSANHHFARTLIPYGTEYTVTLTYNTDDITIEADDPKKDVQFRFVNEAELTYQMVGEEKVVASKSDEVEAIRIKEPASLAIKKMIVGSMDGLYNSYPLQKTTLAAFGLTTEDLKDIKFALYKDKECTDPVLDLSKSHEPVVLSNMDKKGVFTSESSQKFVEGEYYLREEGSSEFFKAVQWAETPPKGVEFIEPGLYKINCMGDRQATGKDAITFYNEVVGKGSLAVYKETIADGKYVPLRNITFGLYEKGAAEEADPIASGVTNGAGIVFINNIPIDGYPTYELRELLKTSGDKDKYTEDSQTARWDVTFDQTDTNKNVGKLSNPNDSAKKMIGMVPKNPGNPDGEMVPGSTDNIGSAENPIINIPRYGDLTLNKVSYTLNKDPKSNTDVVREKNPSNTKRYDNNEPFTFTLYKEDANGAKQLVNATPGIYDHGPIEFKKLEAGRYWIEEGNNHDYFMWAPKKDATTGLIGPFVVEGGDTTARYNTMMSHKIANFQEPLGFVFRKSDKKNVAVPKALFNLYKVPNNSTKESLKDLLTENLGELTGYTAINEKPISVNGSGFGVMQGLPEKGTYALVEYDAGTEHILPENENRITIVEVTAPDFKTAADNAMAGVAITDGMTDEDLAAKIYPVVIEALIKEAYLSQGWQEKATDGNNNRVNVHIKNEKRTRVQFIKNAVDDNLKPYDTTLAGATFYAYKDNGESASPRYTQVEINGKPTFTTGTTDTTLKLEPNTNYVFYESQAPEGYELPTPENTPVDIHQGIQHVLASNLDKLPDGVNGESTIVIRGPYTTGGSDEVRAWFVNNKFIGAGFLLSKIPTLKYADGAAESERTKLGGAEFKLYYLDEANNPIYLTGKYYNGPGSITSIQNTANLIKFNESTPIKTVANQETTVLVNVPKGMKSEDVITAYLFETKTPDGYVKLGDDTLNPEKDKSVQLTIGKVAYKDITTAVYVENNLNENIQLSLEKFNRSKDYKGTSGPHSGAELTLYEKEGGSYVVATERQDSEGYGTWHGATMTTTDGVAPLGGRIVWEKLKPNTEYAIAEKANDSFRLTDVEYKIGDAEFTAAKSITQDGQTLYVLPVAMKNAQTLEVRAYNHPIASQLVVKKMDEGKKPISTEGKFELYELIGELPENWKTGELTEMSSFTKITEKEFAFDSTLGTYSMTGLKIGKYLLVEAEAPNGFAISDKYPSRYLIDVNTTGVGNAGTNSKASEPKNSGEIVVSDGDTVIYTIAVINKSLKDIEDSMKLQLDKTTLSKDLIAESLFTQGDTIKYKLDNYTTGKNEKSFASFVVEDTGLEFYNKTLTEKERPPIDAMQKNDGDYTLTNISIDKAKFIDANAADKTAQAKVYYKLAGSEEYAPVEGVYTLDQLTSIDLAQIVSGNVVSIKVDYGYDDNGEFKEGVGRYFNAGKGIELTGTLNQRDKATDTRGEAIGIRNTAQVIATVLGEDPKVVESTSDINVEAKAMYPWVQLTKKLVDQTGTEIEKKGTYAIGDPVYFKLELSLAEGSPDGAALMDPILVDKLPGNLEFVSATVKNDGGVKRISAADGVSELVTVPAAGSALEQDYVTLFFKGNLEKENTVEVMLKTKTRSLSSNAIDDLGKEVLNWAYVASGVTDNYLSKGNAQKTSFKNDMGIFPQEGNALDPELLNAEDAAGFNEGQPYGAVSANAPIMGMKAGGTRIEKYVKGPNDAGYRQGSRVVNDKPYSYRIDIFNGSKEPMKNIILAELLPVQGDTSYHGELDRATQWRPELYNGFAGGETFTYEGFETDVNGGGVDPSVYTMSFASVAPTDSEVQAALNKVRQATTISSSKEERLNGWAQGYGDELNLVGAFAIDLGDMTIVAGGKASIYVSMKVPNWNYDDEVTNSQKPADADAAFVSSVSNINFPTTASNPVKVTAEPKPVGVGDRVWLDKNGNGIQDSGEEGLQGANVQLTVQSDNQISSNKKATTNENGEYLFKDLSPTGDVPKLNQKYTLKFEMPKYALLTIPYAQNGGIPTATGVVTNNAAEYEAGGRHIDSNADQSTGRTEEFSLKSRPRIEGDVADGTVEAGFDLTYDCGIIPLRNIELKKTDNQGVALKGAEFKLYLPESPEVFVTAISDAKGKVFFPTTSKGSDGKPFNIYAFKEYMIQEVKAPEGYVLDNTAFKVGEYEGEVTLKALNGKDGNAGLTTAVGTIKNTSEQEVEDAKKEISIKKIQIGGTVENFRFKVIIDGKPLLGGYKVTSDFAEGVTDKIADDEGNIILQNGETAVIKLPVGSTYEVAEAANGNYTVTSTGSLNGTITEESSADNTKIVFTNTLKELPVVPPKPVDPKPPTPIDPVDPIPPKPVDPTDPTDPTDPADPADPPGPGPGPGPGPSPGTDPERPAPPPEYEPGNTPDPTSPESPEEIIVVDETGVPLAYHKALDPVSEEYVYVDEQGVPLANMILDDIGTPMENMQLLDEPKLPQTGQKDNGTGIFLGLGGICLLAALALRKKES